MEDVAQPYLCPLCKGNRTHFELIYKLAQEVRKDPDSGAAVFLSDELTTLARLDGRLDLDVRCARCWYVGAESAFVKAAEYDYGTPSRLRARR